MEDQKQRVYDALNKMGIKYEVVEHEPVHTMEDMDRLGLPEEGTGKTAWGRNIKLCFRRTSGKISWCKTGKRYTFCPDERYGTCGGILYR